MNALYSKYKLLGFEVADVETFGQGDMVIIQKDSATKELIYKSTKLSISSKIGGLHVSDISVFRMDGKYQALILNDNLIIIVKSSNPLSKMQMAEQLSILTQGVIGMWMIYKGKHYFVSYYDIRGKWMSITSAYLKETKNYVMSFVETFTVNTTSNKKTPGQIISRERYRKGDSYQVEPIRLGFCWYMLQ